MRQLTVAGLMCSFNGLSRGFLEQALRSIRYQSRPLDEFVFVDDGSTDGTVEFVRQYFPDAHFIKLPNGGLPRARNAGIAAISSDLIAFLDDDDLWAPDRIKKTLIPFQKNSDCLNSTIVFTGARVFRGVDPENGLIVGSLDCYSSWPSCLVGPVVDGNGGIMLPKKVYQKVGQFREDLTHGEDLDYWHRALLNGVKFCQIKEPLFCYRKSHVSMTSNGSYDLKKLEFIKDQLRYDTQLNSKPIIFSIAFASLIRSLANGEIKNILFFSRQIFVSLTGSSALIAAFRLLSFCFAPFGMKNRLREVECVLTTNAAMRRPIFFGKTK